MSSRETLTTKPRRAAAVSPPSSAQTAPAQGSTNSETPEQRHERIALQAYYLAQARGFTPGAEFDDWLAAEALVDGRRGTGTAAAEAPGGSS